MLGGAALALGLAACGNSGSGSGTGRSDRDPAEITDQNVRVWFMEGSIPEEAVTLLEETFAEKFPGNTLTVEIQPWDGIVSKQQTSLASASESPDLVETGNTQSTTFTSVGAFADVSDLYEELGGEKLIPSFVEAGMVDGKNYAFPLYAGARGVFYRKDLLAAADLSEPTTIDEFREVMVALGAANPEGTDGFSGMYFAAVDIHGVDSFMFAAGGDFATDEGDGTFTAALTTPETLAALEQVQGLFSEATTYGLDAFAGFSWLAANPWTFYLIASAVIVWASMPLATITIYSALTQVDDALLEAAQLDGAGYLGRLRNVVFPTIMPVVSLIGVLQVIWDLRVFTHIHVLQQSGGITQQTNLLGTYVYQVGISQGDYGTASALAMIILLLTLVMTAKYLQMLWKQGDLR
jgi:ABC-type glycerol-3-phosphate transport system substrate-binding protein